VTGTQWGACWKSQSGPHCRGAPSAVGAPAPCSSREHRPAAPIVEEAVAVGAQEGVTPAAVAAEEAAAAEAQEEAPAEGGLVDIVNILGAPAVTIVRSSL
jgi:hypothetical protein